MHELELRFTPTLENAQWATLAVRQIAAALLGTFEGAIIEDQDTLLSEIELATGEACCNAVKHGPEKGKSGIHVSVMFKRNKSNLIIAVSDGNQTYDFSEREPDFDSVPESGYGLYIMREMMDKVSYRREKGRNIVTMEKEILQGGE